MPSYEEFQERVAALRQDYRRRLPGKISHMEDMWGVLLEDWDENLAVEFYRAVHSLAGSGATYGFPHVSESALMLEQALQDAIDTGNAPTEAQKDAIDVALTGLKTASL